MLEQNFFDSVLRSLRYFTIVECLQDLSLETIGLEVLCIDNQLCSGTFVDSFANLVNTFNYMN